MGTPILLLAAWQGCNAILCNNDVLARVRSPNGHRVAVVFDRACGPPVRSGTQVSVLRLGILLPSSRGNAALFDNTPRVVHVNRDQDPLVAVRWSSDSVLEVRYDSYADHWQPSREVAGVTIRLVPDSTLAPN